MIAPLTYSPLGEHHGSYLFSLITDHPCQPAQVGVDAL